VILHPGILALIGGSSLVLVMTLYAAVLGLQVLVRWDYDSHAEDQLALERRTYLISTIVSYALGFQILSSLLFIFTLDDIHGLFTGAMCATGSLNANPIGWSALLLSLLTLLACGIWVVLNQIDQRSEDYPLVRLKYGALLLVAPLLGLTLGLQIAYFHGLRPEIITSCCGSLFSSEGSGLASTLVAFPIRPMMGVFYGMSAVFLVVAVWALMSEGGLGKYALSLSSAIFLVVSLAAIVSFLSLYLYEMPTHHCPFDIFQKEYGYVGYPVYGSLFLGVFWGLLPGLFQPLKGISTLATEIGRLERRWIGWSMGAVGIFLLLTGWRVLFGAFSLAEYL
jgi:hypothetical protein